MYLSQYQGGHMAQDLPVRDLWANKIVVLIIRHGCKFKAVNFVIPAVNIEF